MKFFFAAFFIFWSGFFSPATARDKINGWKNASTNPDEISATKKTTLFFYPAISFLKYKAQPGLMEITFPYARLDTSNGGQIAERFEFSKTNLVGNYGLSFPIAGLELKRGNF